MRWSLFFLSLIACGRIGIDERQPAVDAAAAVDAAGEIDAALEIDATVDTIMTLACPADMARLSSASSVCIELADHGDMPWLDGKALCESLGRRYCTDAEWFEGCTNAAGVVGMTGAWEWVAEEAAGIAQKRGGASCVDASDHAVADPYDVRCCGPMI